MPSSSLPEYFPFTIQLTGRAQEQFGAEALLSRHGSSYPPILFYRRLASNMARSSAVSVAATAAQLNLYASLLRIYRHLVDEVARGGQRSLLAEALQQAGFEPDGKQVRLAFDVFKNLFPAGCDLAVLGEEQREYLLLRELLLLNLAAHNRAVDPFRVLLDDQELANSTRYRQVVAGIERVLAKGPVVPGIGMTLVEALHAPLAAAPDSLAGQLGYIREQWAEALPPELLEELLTAFDILDEEQRQWSDGGSGPAEVLHFGLPGIAGANVASGGGAGSIYHGAGHHAGYDQPEYEAFSADADWMSNVVMMAKMTHVWLDQLSRTYARPVTRLDQVPDAELDRLAAWGFTGLWLIGLWERSSASQRIKQLCGNPEAHASAYSLYDYTIAADLGGEPAFLNLKQRAWQRGIRLASDMVPNHTGLFSRWVLEHPDWFVQTDYAPFPTYQFNGEDLSPDPSVTLQVEDGYWNKQDAAVVFRMIDRRDGCTRYIYHGNDGTSIPWNDTAQLNYLIPQVRETVIQTILHVARLTPIIRFDAAMTLAKKHYQRLWYPQRGLGGGIPSRAEHAMGRDEFDAVFPVEFWREVVDRMAQEAPDTLLLAEAFWMMEGYFVRTLGMHRVYNSAFMNMLKQEENAKYRQTIKNVLEFNPEILKRFVNFMNNPDEKTAVEQFGAQGKYFGACVLLSTMPGLPMFGHGQIEGFHEKYGMEYRKAYWNEAVDQGLVKGHELWIFPLLKRRKLFSGSENFALYDFYCHDGSVDENVFAYSNRLGEQRALVLYNNRYGATSGWIRMATPVAITGSGDTTEFYSGSLGQALGVPDDPRCFLAFREISSQHEYLRNAAEICQHGMYAELSEYEFHVFLDFRILEDTPDTPWAALCGYLAGRGVASLEDERIQLLNQPLIGAFGECLQTLQQSRLLETALQNYCAELPPVATSEIDQQGLMVSLAAAHQPDVSAKSLRLLRRSGVSKKLLRLDQKNRRQALAILMTRFLALPLSDDALREYGLGRPLAAFVAGDDIIGFQALAWIAELCGAAGLAWDVWSSALPAERLVQLFNSPLLVQFLMVHDDGGTLWFNKERFEELIIWLALQAAFEQAQGQDQVVVPMTELTALAAAAGYRVRSLLKLAEGIGEGEA
ncbi:MAG: alpha-amylase family glycosyl hydrolase [Trichlorobacter sp.]|uniref:alpha-amylase family glycosyl hydrolase n=1 Tax=Trichlorobacter sp. TaxID=2911007 RepID=UPI00256E626C|nr:alpha-amylase family glycosyl hydrolase [Trichlorobacter sp.]MDK9716428.1 alpha-amylase family glycosyl hydrolase [Trichlorobacter sp.]